MLSITGLAQSQTGHLACNGIMRDGEEVITYSAEYSSHHNDEYVNNSVLELTKYEWSNRSGQISKKLDIAWKKFANTESALDTLVINDSAKSFQGPIKISVVPNMAGKTCHIEVNGQKIPSVQEKEQEVSQKLAKLEQLEIKERKLVEIEKTVVVQKPFLSRVWDAMKEGAKPRTGNSNRASEKCK